jgi:hypothetical protein
MKIQLPVGAWRLSRSIVCVRLLILRVTYVSTSEWSTRVSWLLDIIAWRSIIDTGGWKENISLPGLNSSTWCIKCKDDTPYVCKSFFQTSRMHARIRDANGAPVLFQDDSLCEEQIAHAKQIPHFRSDVAFGSKSAIFTYARNSGIRLLWDIVPTL